jgi:hypothetical protein
MDKAEEKIIKAAAFIRLVATQRDSGFFTFISSLLSVSVITFRRKTGNKKEESQERGGKGKEEGNEQM